MTLPRVRRGLESAALKPHTLRLGADFPQLVNQASPTTRLVLELAWGPSPGGSELFGSARWPADALRFYRDLDEEERMEVLGLAGFYVHEQIHRADLLTTPFGVGFHGRACLEFIGLQNDSAKILAELAGSADHQALRDYRLLSDADTVNAGPAALQARVRYFDFLHGAPRRYVAAGWGGDCNPFGLLGRELDKVVVHQMSASVAIPDSDGRYLRPVTILESRALAITALNLFHRLGGDDWAAREMSLYVWTYYEPRESFPDYRFLLDLYAAVWGHASLPEAIEANGAVWLEQALMIVMITGWYGLHAPPFRADLGVAAAFADSSPVVRLLVALRALEEILGDPKTYDSGVAFLNELDAAERTRELGLQSVHNALTFCLDYLQEVRKKNLSDNSHQGLRRHFERIFAIQQHQLEQRVRWGYNSALAIPDQGDVGRGIRAEEDLKLLFEEPDFELPAGVERWFELRENLLFGYARPSGFWEEVGGYVTTITIFARCARCGEPVVAHDTLSRGAGPWMLRCSRGHVFEVEEGDALPLA